MMCPDRTIWELKPHTEAKHAILRRYLNAWLPIMASWSGRVVYIDGFAGPGIYANGEPGSPIIAITAALGHKHPIKAEVVYLFIEADADRLASLQREVGKLTIPKNMHVLFHCGRFDETVTTILDDIECTGGCLAPTFAFVDPFGWSHTPFSVIQRLLAKPRSEALITFMYEEINRFISQEAHADDWTSLFGTDHWRDILNIKESSARRQAMHDLYERQLRNEAKARFVRSFEMRNKRNATDYFLFFATNHSKGLAKMKDAMWRVDPSGAFQFSDATDQNQLVLFQPQPDYTLLRRQLRERFGNQPVAIDELERFVLEETAFKPTHLRQGVLKPMEREQPPAIQVLEAPPGRRRGQFPPGTRLRFVVAPTTSPDF